MLDTITTFLKTTGVFKMIAGTDGVVTTADIVPILQYLAMYLIVGVLFYLAIVKKFEPLLLMPIAFGMLLANLPGANLIHLEYFFDDYYIAAEGNKFVGALAPSLNSFLDDLNPALYSFGENGNSFSLSIESIRELLYNYAASLPAEQALSAAEIEQLISDEIAAIQNAFSSYVQGAAYLDTEGIIHVKMTTMINEVINHGGLIDILYLGVKLGIYPSLIFLGVGAMTDFSPLIANPKSLLMGAGAQLGVFIAFFGAILSGVFTPAEAGAIGIIGGADGPTAILVTKELAPHLLGAIAIAAYSYMALIPIIQPPFMKLLTTKKEREIKMTNLRPVSKVEKVLFPILVTLIVCLLVPDAAPLVGFLMLGNLFNVSGVADRLSKTAQNELINIVTICLGVSVGATANAENFLKAETLLIIGLGLCAFAVSTCGGLITGKIMCKLTGGKINPLIGSAGVSAVPMAARVSQDVGRKADPSNFLLMHAMGPNVAGVIGSAVAAGVFLSLFA